MKSPLTELQQQIVAAIAMSILPKEIAFIRGCRQETIYNALKRIEERLGFRDVAGLTRYAIASGLLRLEFTNATGLMRKKQRCGTGGHPHLNISSKKKRPGVGLPGRVP